MTSCTRRLNIATEQAALRTLAVWPWDNNNANEAEFSASLREALTIAIEEGDAEINTVRLCAELERTQTLIDGTAVIVLPIVLPFISDSQFSRFAEASTHPSSSRARLLESERMRR